MPTNLETLIRIATEEFRILLPEDKATGLEVEEVEEHGQTGHFFVTLGYWARDNKPVPDRLPYKTITLGAAREKNDTTDSNTLFNPWRRKYKRVEVDPVAGKAVAIRMYEPPIGVS